MKTQHTPGPWIVAHDEVQLHGNTIATICQLNIWNTTEGIVTKEMPWEANARLMAAAPEMLDALKALMHAYASHEFPSLMDARERAKELIAKLSAE